MQKARSHGIAPLLQIVSVWFQDLLTPLYRVLFTFPSRYWFTIGLSGVFSLTGWCRQIQRGFLRSPPTQDYRLNNSFSCKGLSPATVALPNAFQFIRY